ncbi:MAG: hypothetical protein HYZ27_08230 [Deltaproteobacteria bacterium]|nr:hypothetical protein [Deltaproteobacteria bacterium]
MSLLNVRRLHAQWVLGSAMLRKLVVYAFAGRRGAAPWLARLAQEDLAPTPPRAFALAAGASRCIGCGLCDSVAEPHESPSRLIMGMARHPADAPLAGADLDRLAALAPAIAEVCPARVAVGDLVTLVRENRRMLIQ